MIGILVSNEEIYKGNLILVNSDFPLRSENISLTPVNEKYPQVLLQAEAAQMLGQALRSFNAAECKDTSVSASGCCGERERTEIQKEGGYLLSYASPIFSESERTKIQKEGITLANDYNSNKEQMDCKKDITFVGEYYGKSERTEIQKKDTVLVSGCCGGREQTNICKESIALVSGYRSEREQTDIYESSLKENGAEFTAKFVALPNHSEHQTGLAIDLGLEKENIDFICPDFPYEGICEKFRAAAPQYGFIERYQMGKENITKIAPEPWHFRYVGFPHSAIISENNFAYEEYIEYLKQFSANGEHLKYDNGRTYFEIFYVQAKKAGSTKIILPYHTDGAAPAYEISGNNIDGFVVTCTMHLRNSVRQHRFRKNI